MATKTKTESDPLRYKRGISWNLYLASDKLWLKDEAERLAKEDNRSVSEFVLGIVEAAIDAKRKK